MFTGPQFTEVLQEDFSSNTNNTSKIENIIPTTELLINFRTNGVRVRKPCLLYAEKIEYRGLIQLRLSEKCDQRRMYLTTVDGVTFHTLKQEQALNVTFLGFIENLVRLLQDCQAAKLEMHLVQPIGGSNNNGSSSGVSSARHSESSENVESNEYELQFVELRPFKNLVHLSLPSRLASLNIVLYYINLNIVAMQKNAATQEHSIEQLKQELQTQMRRNELLNNENTKLRENLLENSRNLNKRHEEEMQQMQENIRQISEQRQNDNERSRKTISALQGQMDKLNTEKEKIVTEKSQERKRCETLTEELAAAKSDIANIKEVNEKLSMENASLKNSERKTEMHMMESRKHISELQEKIKKYDKAKADIIAELEAEKNITQTKRRALEIATEEISKANEIIMKQSQELLKLKKTIDWRTEVALQQERAIIEKEKMLQIRNEEIEHLQIIVENLRIEIPKQLETLRQFSDSLEKKYSHEINVLKEKLRSVDKENNTNYSHFTSTSRRK